MPWFVITQNPSNGQLLAIGSEFGEDGSDDIATFATEEEAREMAKQQPVCQAWGIRGIRVDRLMTHRQRVRLRRRRTKEHHRRYVWNAYYQVWYVDPTTGKRRPIEEVPDGTRISIGDIPGVLRHGG